MSEIIAEDGTRVTDEMVDAWCEALDHDQWPQGWHNVGEVVDGGVGLPSEATQTLSVKVPASLKRAIDRKAKGEGVSTSAFIRRALARALL